MNKLTEFLTKPFLEEGVNDPGIFKGIFLAGGPGSGKSYVVSKLFGIPERVNISASGLKMVNQDKELEMLLKKYYGTVDLANMPVDLFRQLADPRYDDYSGLRHFAKSLSVERLRLYVEGRLGVIIDGTGHKFKSVQAKRQKLMSVGYDTFMVFVNTSLEVALQRNERRSRALPEHIVRKSWEDVQKNMGYFQGMFGMNRFMIVQNDSIESVAQSHKRFTMLAKKGVNKFLKAPLGKTAKDWVEKQKQIKKIGVKDLVKKAKMAESINIPVEIGDTVRMGKFKNKKVVVKSVDWNEKGDLLINGRPALKFRITKKDEAARKPRKKGQHRGSSSHSDLYTDENPKGTIKGLKFATVKDAKASVSKINGSGKTHAHKIQAAVAMEQRAREMGKSSQAAVYRAYINKMKKKTKEKNEDAVPSPSRKGVEKMKKRGNSSVPYGSGYDKVNEANAVKGSKVEKFITGHNLTMKGKKYKEIEFETLGIDNSSKMIKLKIIAPKNLFGMETPVKFATLRRGPFTKTNTGKKLKEQTKIKKTIGVFGGRFQPFHSGHLATYRWLFKQVDEAYITTSNIKQPPRHPMNFKEKVRHMVKMGIPKNRIVEEKSPYVAKNLLNKFNSDTTAVVYAFGQKDAGRLKAGKGKYFQDYKKSKGNINGYEENGYFITAPQFGSVSGTQTRQILGNPKIDDSERQKLFKKAFGYFDGGVYQMMTNKFKKLFEEFKLTVDLIEEFLLDVDINKIIKESSINTRISSDDGPGTFYKDLSDYYRVAKGDLPEFMETSGWSVINYLINDKTKDRHDPEDDPTLIDDPISSVSFRRAGSIAGTKDAELKHKQRLQSIIDRVGGEIIKWMGFDGKGHKISAEPNDEYGRGKTGWAWSGTKGKTGKLTKQKQFNFAPNIKERINLNDEVNLLIEGGAYGHLNHPFDDKNLTFSDFKTLIINTLQGNLDSEGVVTEKTDGQNIMISWKNNKLIAARNKGHIKNHGANALDLSGIKNMFAGRGDLEVAFVEAISDLQKAIKRLNKKQRDKIFAEGKKFMSLEVIYPKTANVIPYDRSLLQFHGTIEYDSAGSPIGEDRGSARVLAGMIKQINQNIQKTYSITKPFITNLPKVKNFAKKQSYFLGKLNKLQSEYQMSDNDTLADYHQAYWMEYINNGARNTDYKNPSNDVLMKLTKRWAFFDKSYKIPQIKKDLKEYPKFLDWVLSTDKMDHAKLQKQHIRDWEVLFFELGAEILSNLKDFIAANPSKSAQQIRKDLKTAINKVKTSKDPKVLTTLKTQLDRLNAIGGLKAVVPSEGITFVYKGKLYKYTGAFAPANQILGMLKFV